MTEKFITKIRNIIADGTSLALTDCFTPALPQEGSPVCAITLLGGIPTNNLCEVEYYTYTFRTLVRGTENDTTTRALVDDIFDALHMAKDISITGGKIINIIANTTPIYVGKDENQRILYNMTFSSIVKGE
jgi:hypothetical protein